MTKKAIAKLAAAGFFVALIALSYVWQASTPPPQIAQAQSGTVPQYAVPIGLGVGTTGFGSFGPCATAVAFIGQGASANPACGGNTLLTQNLFGGTAINSSLTLQTTNAALGTNSGDTANLFGSTVNIGNQSNATGTVNIGGPLGGGVNFNVGNASNGLVAYNVFNSSGGKQVWVPGTGTGTTPGAVNFPTGNSSLAALNLADQVVSGGANVTSQSLTTGNVTIDCGSRPLQQITNGGAFSITAPSNDGSCMVKVTNSTGAGAITFPGFSVGSNTGDALDTTNGHVFFISIARIGGASTYAIKALQ